MKLREAEIDELYRASERDDTSVWSQLLVCCELKGVTEDLTEPQLLKQLREGAAVAEQMFAPGAWGDSTSAGSTHHVMVMGVKVVGDSMLHVLEFDTVSLAEASRVEGLSLRGEAAFLLTPAVPGIGNPGFRLQNQKHRPAVAADLGSIAEKKAPRSSVDPPSVNDTASGVGEDAAALEDVSRPSLEAN